MKLYFVPDEPLISTGYPLGTDLVGKATIVRGSFIDFRKSNKTPVIYLQTNISLVRGMSGGPLTDQCGNVVGINTMSLAGLSLFVSAKQAKIIVPDFTDQEIKKLKWIRPSRLKKRSRLFIPISKPEGWRMVLLY